MLALPAAVILAGQHKNATSRVHLLAGLLAMCSGSNVTNRGADCRCSCRYDHVAGVGIRQAGRSSVLAKKGLQDCCHRMLSTVLAQAAHMFLADEVQLQGDELLQLRQHRRQEGLAVDRVTVATNSTGKQNGN